jgi:hypothetical protein
VIAAMTPARLRRVQRRAHLLAAAVLFAYVYAPLGPELEDAVRFAVFPMVALTGIAMWQAARIRRTVKSLRGMGRRSSTRRPKRQKGRLRRATP